MAPKKRKVVGTLVKTTKKVVEETLKVSVLGSQEESQKDATANAATEDNHKVVEVVVGDKQSPEPPKPQEPTAGENDKLKQDTQPPKAEAEKSKEEKQRKRKKGGERRRRKRAETGGEGGYKRYVFRVLKQVHPGMGVSSRAMAVLDGMMGDMFERLAEEAARLSKYTGKATLSSREIQNAVRLVLPGELGKHAVAEEMKAVSTYMTAGDKAAV